MSENPLKKYFRQPKIYLRLPSGGNFYPEDSLIRTVNGEYPVYPMTAKDTLLLKTPDALMNGQATVDLIQSCVPNIINAWNIPSIDLDAILVAIRLATNGEQLDVTAYVPGLDENKTYVTDLRVILDQLLNATYETEVEISEDMKVYVRPLSYREFNNHAAKALEEQRIVRIVSDENIDDAKKIEVFGDCFRKLTELTVNAISQSIVKIVITDSETNSFVTVDNHFYIEEFMQNADKEFFNKLIDHLDLQKKKFSIKPFTINFTDEEIASGSPESMELPITLDASTFFA